MQLESQKSLQIGESPLSDPNTVVGDDSITRIDIVSYHASDAVQAYALLNKLEMMSENVGVFPDESYAEVTVFRTQVAEAAAIEYASETTRVCVGVGVGVVSHLQRYRHAQA